MKKYLIIGGILLVSLITISSVKPHKHKFEDVSRQYIECVVDEVHIELFGLKEQPLRVEKWMTKPFTK